MMNEESYQKSEVVAIKVKIHGTVFPLIEAPIFY